MTSADILVVGSGMAGLSAALEAAEAGYRSILVEKEPFLGGRVARMHRFFPKLCPPSCGLELYFRRIKNNPRVTYLTQATVQRVTGQKGDFTVDVALQPRYVLPERCTACGECVAACTAKRVDGFNYGVGETKAIYLPHLMAMPPKYVIDRDACRGKQCAECISACRYGAIDLNMEPHDLELRVGSIVLATGWRPYDASRLTNLGFGKHANVITNVMMERLAAMEGPTGGRIVRPSDGGEISSIAFAQCAGSRDENHLAYCSAVCCMASLKQVTYVRERYPDADVYVFFMDIRAPGRYEDFYRKVSGDEHVKVLRGKVAKLEEDAASGDIVVEVDDTMYGGKIRTTVQMVVLATGTVPEGADDGLPGISLIRDQFGFATEGVAGIHPAGVAKRPMDVAGSVRDGTGAALRAIQDVVGR
jgi:quinone-modifying oxidoreductase subunit QmoA